MRTDDRSPCDVMMMSQTTGNLEYYYHLGKKNHHSQEIFKGTITRSFCTWHLGEPSYSDIFNTVDNKYSIRGGQNGDSRTIVTVENFALNDLCVFCFLQKYIQIINQSAKL